MRVALVDPVPTNKVYSVALLKLGAMLKGDGHECHLYSGRLPKAGAVDAVWITTLFTYDIPRALGVALEAKKRAPEVRVGGVAATLLPHLFEDHGLDVHRGLIPEAEFCAPDYGLLADPPDYSVTHTSRGCVRKCGFCMVPKLEPTFESRDWERDLCPGAEKILFYDNNWLAKDFDAWLADVQIIKRLVKIGRVREMDFNQGLDCRLLTDDHVDALRGVPIRPVRFAFDGMQEDGHFQRAVERMVKAGHRDFGVYALYNFKDTPEDFYYRLRECARLTEELRVSVQAFPMRYQPILDIDQGREHVGQHWTMAQRAGFASLLGPHSRCGQMAAKSIWEFEYWFGKTGEEFAAMLAYPKIRELAQRRKAALRLTRARARGA